MLKTLAPELAEDREVLTSARLPALTRVITIGNDVHAGCTPFAAVSLRVDDAARQRLATVTARIDAHAPVNIQFTSGTTGLPKGATLSHRNLINNGFFVGEATGIEPGSRVCIPVPLYHCFGMLMGNLGCVTQAATIVDPSESFEPLKTLATVEA